MTQLHLLLVTLLLVSVFTLRTIDGASRESDLISKLPGVDFPVPFKQYAGYLDGGKGRQLFYWLVESVTNPSQDPLVLWLNGGPGCSSLGGLFTENGPFRVKLDGKSLSMDPYSWNGHANVLYIESPVNVGFSYNTSTLDQADFYNDNAETETLYHALQEFFSRHDQFKGRKFYITGESYGGIYIPLVTQQILRYADNHTINLQGIAIGNGVTDLGILSGSRIEYAYYHGLYGIDHWDQIQNKCCHMTEDKSGMQCDYPYIFSNYTIGPRNNNLACASQIGELLLNLKSSTINLYYIYDSCNVNESKKITHQCVNTNYSSYLNQADVRRALHVPTSLDHQEWLACNNTILLQYEQQYKSMDQVYVELLNKHNFTNIILYYGDADIVCDFLSAQRFLIHKLRFTMKEPSHEWHLDGRVAGILTRFTNGLRFFTVHGAGHMVPTQKPAQSLAIFKDLLNIETIS